MYLWVLIRGSSQAHISTSKENVTTIINTGDRDSMHVRKIGVHLQHKKLESGRNE